MVDVRHQRHADLVGHLERHLEGVPALRAGGVASYANLDADRLAAPAIAQGAAKTLKFVPQSNLANFDPIWGTQYVVRNASQLVWDTLYGMDSNLQPKRRMVEGEEVSDDGLIWTFKLRPGLKFHDGSPVLAKDCVVSIERWSNRDAMGLMLKAIQKELVAVDDRTFKWVLSKPYPKILLALGKVGTPCCFIMPERLAKTDPFNQKGRSSRTRVIPIPGHCCPRCPFPSRMLPGSGSS